MRNTTNPRKELQALKARVVALEEECQRLRSILDQNPAVTYRANLSGDFHATYVSAGIMAQLGYQPGEFTENSTFWAENLHPADAPRVLAEMAQAVESGSGSFEYRFRHRDGTYRWMRSECHVYGESQSPELLGYWTDITARKEAEEALREGQERFEMAAEGANEGLWDWHDMSQDGEWWSPRWYELLGYVDQEVEASFTNFKSFLHPDDRDALAQAVTAHIEQRAPFDMEYRLRTKSGDYRWFRGRGQIRRDHNTKVLRMSGSIRDISEQKRTEDVLPQGSWTVV